MQVGDVGAAAERDRVGAAGLVDGDVARADAGQRLERRLDGRRRRVDRLVRRLVDVVGQGEEASGRADREAGARAAVRAQGQPDVELERLVRGRGPEQAVVAGDDRDRVAELVGAAAQRAHDQHVVAGVVDQAEGVGARHRGAEGSPDRRAVGARGGAPEEPRAGDVHAQVGADEDVLGRAAKHVGDAAHLGDAQRRQVAGDVVDGRARVGRAVHTGVVEDVSRLPLLRVGRDRAHGPAGVRGLERQVHAGLRAHVQLSRVRAGVDHVGGGRVAVEAAEDQRQGALAAERAARRVDRGEAPASVGGDEDARAAADRHGLRRGGRRVQGDRGVERHAAKPGHRGARRRRCSSSSGSCPGSARWCSGWTVSRCCRWRHWRRR